MEKNNKITSPLLDYMDNLGKVRNPNYNPKTKKGRTEPVYIKGNTPTSPTSGLWADYSRASNRIGYDNVDLGISVDEYKKDLNLGITRTPYTTDEALNKARANTQSALQQTTNMLIQGIGSEVILGTFKSMSDIIDSGLNAFKEEGTNDYTNPVSLYFENLQNDLKDKFTIYRENPNDTFQLNDWGWYMDNAVSIFSSASMLIPSTGAVKLLGLASKGLNAGKLTRGMAKLINGINKGGTKDLIKSPFSRLSRESYKNKFLSGTKNSGRLEKSINDAIEIGTTALLSRTAENYMEARGVYTEVYDDVLNKLNNFDSSQKEEFFKNNPDLINKSNEDIAKIIAGKSADTTFKNDYWMLLMDILQFKAISSLWKGSSRTFNTARQRIANRNAIETMKAANEGREAVLESTGWVARRKEAIKYGIQHPLSSIAAVEWSEGLEEGYQGIQTEKGKEVAAKYFDKKYRDRSFESYIKDGSIWEQAVWGVLGGIAFQAMGTKLGDTYRKIKGKINKDNLSEEDYKLSQLSADYVAISEIEGRSKRTQAYIEAMQQLNNNKNPFKNKLDSKGIPIREDGVTQLEDLTNEEAERLKEEVTNEYITSMALDAVDSGTYDLFREYVTNSAFSEQFKKSGLDIEQEDKSLSKYLVDKMDEIRANYDTALSDVFHSADVTNESVVRATARQIVREKLDIDSLNKQLTSINKKLDEVSDNETIDSNYLERERIKYINEKLKEVDEAEEKFNDDVKNNRISKQARDEYKKQLDVIRKQLLNYAANNTTFGLIESVKESLKNGDNHNKLISEFDDFVNKNSIIKDNSENETSSNPKKTTQSLIRRKIELEDNIDYREYTLPKTDKDYQERYDTLSMDINKATIERYNQAAERIAEYIENQEDIDKAEQDVIAGLIPEKYQKDLDILKIGHYTTEKYTAFIKAVSKKAKNDRTKKEKEEKKVIVNDNELSEENANNKRQETDSVLEETDKRQNESSVPSTGEENKSDNFNPNEIIPIEESDIKEETEDADKAAEDIIKRQSEEFALTIDDRAISLGTQIVVKIAKDSRNLIDDLIDKDVNSEEFNKLLNLVIDELINQNIDRNTAVTVARSCIRMALKSLHRREKNSNPNAEKFKILADQLSTRQKINRELNSVIGTIDDTEIDSVIEEFLDAYIEKENIITKKGNKTIINIENLFYELINNKDIGIEQAYHIYYNIKNYINSKANNKYIFTNKRTLNKYRKDPNSFFNEILNNRRKVEKVSSYMHISAPTRKTNEYNREINSIENGAEVEVSYGQRDDGSKTDVSISLKHNGVEIGYISTVDVSDDNTEYKQRKQTKGFVYVVKKLQSGEIRTNFDSFFEGIIIQSNSEYKAIWELLQKYNNVIEQEQDGEIGEGLTNEEINKLLLNPEIIRLLASGDIKLPKKKIYKEDGFHYDYIDALVTNRAKAEYILNSIRNVIFYNQYAQSKGEFFASYEYWKQNIFSNYENTRKIEEALKNKEKILVKLSGLDNRKAIITNTEQDIEQIGLMYDSNPFMAVTPTADGVNIINEKTGKSYPNVVGFVPGTAGFLIQDNPNAPIIAKITSGNYLNPNSQLYNDIQNEIINLLTKFQNKEISFDEIQNAFTDLFSGPGSNFGGFFNGYSVIKTNKGMFLNIKGETGQYSLIIYKYKKDGNTGSTGITYIPNGDKSKAMSSISVNNKFIETIAKELISNLKFNTTFYNIVNNKNDNEHSNRYFYKENGKLIIDINGNKTEYNSFGHFAIANNAFKTNQGRNSQGGFFEINDKANSLFVDVATTKSPVERQQSIESVIESASTDKPVDTKTLFKTAGISERIINLLTGGNQFGISLIPERFFYDSKMNAEASNKNGKFYFGKKVFNDIKNGGNRSLIRLAIHEHLHNQFAKESLFNKKELVKELLETYDALVKSIEKDLANENKTSARYKYAKAIKDFIDKKGFNFEDYFSKLPKSRQEELKNASKEELERIFAEEWLVESLTQDTLIKYLNDTNWENGEVNVENIENENKTIWQKIIDILLKLFGKDTSNIKNNTILARQYQILGNNINENKDIKTEENTEIEEVEKTEENIDEEIINEATVTNPLQEKKKFERIKEDDFDMFSVNETIEEVQIDNYRNNPENNPNGFNTIENMNDYLNLFPEQYKPLIAKMLEDGRIKYVC